MSVEVNPTKESITTVDPLCIYCKETLRYPIRKIENLGSFCVTCFDKSAYIHQHKNQELQYVGVNVQMPCKYSYRGCNEKGTVAVISKHEKKCLYQDKVCPYYYLNKCNMANHIPDLMEHFTEYHSSQIYVSDNDCISLPYNITDNMLDEYYMLAFDDDNILLNLKARNNEMHLLMYYIGNLEDMRQNVCYVEHHNDDICNTEKTCVILHEKELGTVQQENENATTFNRTILESYFGREVSARITLKKEISKLSSDDILLRLECPICSNFMKASIKVCSTGHSICNECEYKLDECPLCALPFYGARNFALESIGDMLKSFVRSERVPCPLRNELSCLWKGSQYDVIEHLKEYHSNKMVTNKTLMRVLHYVTEFSDVNYLMTWGQVFKIICKKDKGDDCMAFIIELIGYDEDAQRYNYNICFNSLYKQSLIWYMKSKVLRRRRIEYYVDYIAMSRIVCNKQFNISCTITRNKRC